MKTLKYVIVKCEGKERAILFDEKIIHACVYDSTQVVSAGFCKFKLNTVTKRFIIETWGGSESLKIKEGRGKLDEEKIFQSLQPGMWDYFFEDDEISN